MQTQSFWSTLYFWQLNLSLWGAPLLIWEKDMERGRGGVWGWFAKIKKQKKKSISFYLTLEWACLSALRPFELLLCHGRCTAVTLLLGFSVCSYSPTFPRPPPSVSFYVWVGPFFIALLSTHLLSINLVRPALSPHPPRLTPSTPFSIPCTFSACHFRSHFIPVFVKSSRAFGSKCWTRLVTPVCGNKCCQWSGSSVWHLSLSTRAPQLIKAISGHQHLDVFFLFDHSIAAAKSVISTPSRWVTLVAEARSHMASVSTANRCPAKLRTKAGQCSVVYSCG